jgi:uncharacterized protein
VLKTAVAKPRLGRDEELAALKRLDDKTRRREGRVGGPAFPGWSIRSGAVLPDYGGHCASGWEPPRERSQPD